VTFDRSTWRTPTGIVDAVHEAFGPAGFDLDPATSPDNPTRARRFYAPGGVARATVENGGVCLGDDALAGSWPGMSLFLNPPWRAGMSVAPWTDRAMQWLYHDARRAMVLLLPATLNAAWFHRVIDPPRPHDGTFAKVFAFRGRVAFIRPDTGDTGDARTRGDVVLVVLGRAVNRDDLRDSLFDNGFPGQWL